MCIYEQGKKQGKEKRDIHHHQVKKEKPPPHYSTNNIKEKEKEEASMDKIRQKFPHKRIPNKTTLIMQWYFHS
jgi:hypothetical protein